MKHLALTFAMLLAAASAHALAYDMDKDAMDDGMMEDKAMHDDDGMKDHHDGMMDDKDDMSEDAMMDDHGKESMKDDGMMDESMGDS